MNYLEHINYRLVSPPAALGASGTVTSSWVDANGLLSFNFIAEVGAVAEDKKIKLELLGADNASGTNSAQIGVAEFTAPETITGRALLIRGRPLPGLPLLCGEGDQCQCVGYQLCDFAGLHAGLSDGRR